MKKIIFILVIVFAQNSIARCQDNSSQNFIKEISTDSFTLKYSCKSLPDFIRKYLNEKNGKKFKISKRKFNPSDIDVKESTSRKLSYVGISQKYYILSYEHGGKSHHEHSIIFEVNSDQIIRIYNFITSIHNNVAQLKYFLTTGLYTIQTLDEI